MRKTLISKDQSGSSLIETVVAASIMVSLSLATVNLFQNQVESASYVEDKFSSIDLEKDINFLFFDSAACERNFKGKNVRNSFSLKELQSATGSSQVKVQSDYDKLNIQSMRLIPPTNIAANSIGSAQIEVATKRLRKGGGPQELRPIQLPIFISVDGSLNIISCSSSINNVATGPSPETPSRAPANASKTKSCQAPHFQTVEHLEIYNDRCGDPYMCVNGMFLPRLYQGSCR